MLSLDLADRGTLSRSEYLYRTIRDAIVAGELAPEEKLPSKRKLADELGCSLITVESALSQLVAEGYIEARPRRGYYVERLGKLPEATAQALPKAEAKTLPEGEQLRIDTSHLPARPDRSALLLWERSLRHVLSAEDLDEAFSSLTPQGLPRLQQAIATHLAQQAPRFSTSLWRSSCRQAPSVPWKTRDSRALQGPMRQKGRGRCRSRSMQRASQWKESGARMCSSCTRCRRTSSRPAVS